MRNPHTRGRRLTAAATTVVALALVPATASAREPVKLRFEKDCPVWTCTGSLVSPGGKPIRGSSVTTESTPLWFSLDETTLHYSAVETVASRDGRFTMRLLGVFDFAAEPDVTHVIGTVESGTWRGRDLTGAGVTARATRAFATTLRGVIRVSPAR